MLLHLARRTFAEQPITESVRKSLTALKIPDSRRVYYQPSMAILFETMILDRSMADPYTKPSLASDSGAICAFTGHVDHLSPDDKRIVDYENLRDEVWWEGPNVPASEKSWGIVKDRATNFMSTLENLYIVDGYIGADPNYRLAVRAICGRAYHAMFLNNTLIKDD
jgi:phosphoenolpyruvate carboxykinase (ATP)